MILFLYAIHILDNLHDLVLGKNCLIGGLFLYPVSSGLAKILEVKMSDITAR